MFALVIVVQKAPTRYAGLAWLAVFFVARGVVGLVRVDPADPGSYRQDWGGPTYVGVLLVHAGPGLLVVVLTVVWWRRRFIGPRS